MATKTYLIFKIKATDYVCIWHHLLLFFIPSRVPISAAEKLRTLPTCVEEALDREGKAVD